MHDDFTDPYEYDEERLSWFEQFSMAPAEPGAIETRIDDGQVLETIDLPRYLEKRLIVDTDTGLVLYRLVQLFGTPNVPGLVAGGDQPERERTTWQYLFELTYDPEEGPTEEYLLSIFDSGTDVSIGLSGWREGDGDERAIPEPTGEVTSAVSIPDDEELLVAIVQLALNIIEEPVPATYKDLWV